MWLIKWIISFFVKQEEVPWKFVTDQKGRRVKKHGKFVVQWSALTVLNMMSGFKHKYLCTGPTINMGDACAYSCPYCYVKAMSHGRFNKFLKAEGLKFQDVLIRRENAVQILKEQLEKLSSKQREYRHVVYSSTTVDVAANTELVEETAEVSTLILQMTNWDIRLLSKSNMLPQLVGRIPQKENFHERLILGVSTGTFDDELAQALETGTPLVSKRIASLHRLQDAGYRTFGMVCPSMPMATTADYEAFARMSAELLRYDRMEHVWAEPINVREDNFTRTIASLDAAGLHEAKKLLIGVCDENDEEARERLENYHRATFEAHKPVVPPGKLRYLQYVNRDKDLPYWLEQEAYGAVILGTAKPRFEEAAAKKKSRGAKAVH